VNIERKLINITILQARIILLAINLKSINGVFAFLSVIINIVNETVPTLRKPTISCDRAVYVVASSLREIWSLPLSL
jgi:hypothetical protein